MNYIYLMIADNGLFKIGETSNIKNRITQIQTNSPCAVEQFFYFEDHGNDEKELHNLFENKKVRREWFALDRNDIEKILQDFAYELHPDILEYILKTIKEMEMWGFFKLGKTELFNIAKQLGPMRCSVAMELKAIQKAKEENILF